jgi:hypothetical protein
MRVAAVLSALLSPLAWASPISSAARAVIPSEVRQIISVDYRAVRRSDAALALEEQALPDDLKELEGALKSIGINPHSDLDNLTFASFRNGREGLKTIGLASGSFSLETILKKMPPQFVKPLKYYSSDLYPMSKTMAMTFLDRNTLLFGDDGALIAALNRRAGHTSGLDSNRQVVDMIASVEAATVWSVLDQQGSLSLLLSAAGEADKLPEYESIKNRVLGMHYAMNFENGVKFDMDVVTSDSSTSAQLSSLLKVGVLYKRIRATPAQKIALQNVTVKSDRSDLQLHFEADHKQFENLLQAQFFAAVAR